MFARRCEEISPSRPSFPIQEEGHNDAAQVLQRHEIAAMRANQEILNRVLDSYRLMLDFYGMRLVSAETGQLAPVEPAEKFEQRYENLVGTQ